MTSGSEVVLSLNPLLKDKWCGPSQHEHDSSGLYADVGSHYLPSLEKNWEEWSSVGLQNKAAIEF